MSIFKRFATLTSVLIAMVAFGTMAMTPAADAATTSPQAIPQPKSCPPGWEFDIIQKTPHQTVYFQQGAHGPARLNMSVTRTVTKHYSISVTVSVSAKAAIFESISASGTVGFAETVSTSQQTGVTYIVPKKQHWFAADILKHWTVFGHLYWVRGDCTTTFSHYPTVNVYWPFDWNHKLNTPFINY